MTAGAFRHRYPRPDGLPPLLLIKWRGLPYASATWETTAVASARPAALRSFLARRAARATPPAPRPARTADFVARKAEESYRGGNTLRPYQLDGLNWLLFSWHQRRRCEITIHL
jgi:chromodomain-helicase-DNA-binding protein 7